MSEEEVSDWEGIEGLPESESSVMFASSNATFMIPDTTLHPITKSIAIFVLFVAASGFLNGLDYASPDSGLVQPDEFVYQLAQSAPINSAMLDGFVYDHDGEPIEGAEIILEWEEKPGWFNSSITSTDADGSFSYEYVKPGLARIDITVERGNYTDTLVERLLLSPPAFIEPYGFTRLDFHVPSPDEFNEEPCPFEQETCTKRLIDRNEEQKENPRMDPSAAGIYIMLGYGFMGVSLIAVGFVIWALRSGSVAVLRMSTIFAFFGMGHYYAACILGLTAFLLTFAIPKRNKVLEMGAFDA
ncbi:MAG: carboxypeptidase-like regulatory domain-containing protein, partial [Candidatus Thermoplasmatota archaeon]|nr:carboxypeptidase-like regulatory domain-containing protein [Candidatus Thermoplasmatota archaeon]